MAKACLVCGSTEFYIVAEGGMGENAECCRCGSLHLNDPFGLKLLRPGKPKPKVISADKTEQEFDSDEEAFAHIKANWERGMYMIDSGGVMATDPRYRP